MSRACTHHFLLYLVLQGVRSWHHAAPFAFVTTALAIVKACGLLPYAYDRYAESSPAAYAFGAPTG